MNGTKRISVIAGVAVVALLAGCRPPSVATVNRPPVVDPDFSGAVIPPNIAPLNFMLREGAVRYRVLLYGALGDTIRVCAKGPLAKVRIPPGKWKKLLQANRSFELMVEVREKRDGVWRRYDVLTCRIAAEEIDGYLIYRRIFGYKTIPEMEIRQRRLGSFDERTVLNNRTLSKKSLSCINCHSFCVNDPGRMIVHMRGEKQGMLLVKGNKTVKIDTRTRFNKGPASYASWHPSGRFLAFAVMKVNQTLHSIGDPRVVIDESSDLILYDANENMISTHPSIAAPGQMETLPEWSPDGRYLYFCSAPQPKKVDNAFYRDLKYREIRYDLVRIPFDSDARTWGEPEIVLSSQQTGMSNVQPKISPDGRFLLFVTMPYSYFAVYDDQSDLCMMDLSTGSWRRLDAVNSGCAESFHTWSSNSRWFVFNSRRRDGMCGAPYFAYVDSAGNVMKPFLLPQRDPAFYDSHLKSFNVPVLTKEPVPATWRELSRVAADSGSEIQARLDSLAGFDGITGASAKKTGENYAP
ncbi:MAG: PD40 domain-containing protein [Chitinispirillaceae bacterium]|nr:PD40 domain-containing protein [Chitinispirillaceae bacterium]